MLHLRRSSAACMREGHQLQVLFRGSLVAGSRDCNGRCGFQLAYLNLEPATLNLELFLNKDRNHHRLDSAADESAAVPVTVMVYVFGKPGAEVGAVAAICSDESLPRRPPWRSAHAASVLLARNEQQDQPGECRQSNRHDSGAAARRCPRSRAGSHCSYAVQWSG